MTDSVSYSSWSELDLDSPADTEDVEEIFPEFEGPICKGVLRQINDLTDVEWDSDEVWETLNSTNAHALADSGYNGEVVIFSRDDAVD